ncbi:MAG: ATP synthase F1 subunit delta [Bacilli bacterium]|jgi:F-type H+-transporting ATPase subunit delta|nr:ATP synthase F1 subunit delta [Bacilli bacterium]
MISAVAMQYALALDSLKLNYDEVLDDLSLVKTALSNKMTSDFFTHPLISDEEKKNVIRKTFEHFHQQILNFIFVLIDNERMAMIEDIIDSYIFINDEKNNIMRVDILVSTSLSKEKEEQLIQILAQRFGKKIKANIDIDTKIIGGLIIKYNGQILDDSVIGKLKSLKEIFSV